MKLKISCENTKIKNHLTEFFKDFYIKDDLKGEVILNYKDSFYELKLSLEGEIVFNKPNNILDNSLIDLNKSLLEIKNVLNNPDYLEYYYFPTVKNVMAGLPEYGYDRKRSTNFKREIYSYINENVLCFQFENEFLYKDGKEATHLDLFFFDNIVKLRIGNNITESYVLFDMSSYAEADLCSNPELEDLIMCKLDSIVDKGMIKIKKRI